MNGCNVTFVTGPRSSYGNLAGSLPTTPRHDDQGLHSPFQSLLSSLVAVRAILHHSFDCATSLISM